MWVFAPVHLEPHQTEETELGRKVNWTYERGVALDLILLVLELVTLIKKW